MRKALLIAFIAVSLIPAVSLASAYTLTPWPYGVIAWVLTGPNDAVLQKLEKAVQDVFSFWHQPLPESAENWDELIEMQESVWVENKYDPFTAGFVPIPSQTASVMWAVPLPSWQGEKILPLTLIALPNFTLLESLADSTAGAAFSSRSMRNSTLSLNRDPSLAVLMTRSNSVLFDYNSHFYRYDLNHELSHWLTALICQRHCIILHDVPLLLQEGVAEYTAHTLDRDNTWRDIAAVWAEDNHGLVDVPFYMLYPIGTSLVSFLVERDGIDGFVENFPHLVANWDQSISDITPAWQAWAYINKLDEGQRAYAEATIEQLTLCGLVLRPVLSEEAYSILDRLYSLSGTMQDIERFWEIISAPIPKPSSDAWKQLQQQAHTIFWVASGDADPEVVKTAAYNEYQLSRLWAKGDWDGYHALLIKTLRDVVAHYGTPPVEETTQ